ncbi:nuclear pore glycoprotein p62 isoform X2 [Venturia canescens]|uniref:nuclear pore glycoprotein p62 isoform X2 n=1 Tax=Venturia canescens TaxID=32260 RepID=UPI001C9C431F|nr:nuclear pore glycoprotein p62 isoform X2 [Venturia canescens]
MSFSFDNSKTQAGGNSASSTPGFTAGTTGAGDTGKVLSSGFLMSTMQNQVKPSGVFGSALSGIPSSTFGLSFASTSAIPSSLNSGIGGGATVASGFGATTFGTGGLGTSTTTSTAGSLNFGIPKPAVGTSDFSLGTSTVATAVSTAPKSSFGTPVSASTVFTPSNATTAPATAASIATTGAGFTITDTTTSIPQPAISLGNIAPSSGFSLIPSTASTSLNLTFGQPTVASATTTAPTGFSLNAVTTAPSTGLSLGSSVASTNSTSFTLNKTSANQGSATTITTNPTPQTTLGTITTVSSSNITQTGTTNFCQLEESINKWTLELEEQEKAFVNQATQVNTWDKLLIVNGEKITALNQEVERVKLEQQQLEHELDYVVGQQKELQDCLAPLEKELASLSVADPERDYTYRLAENLDKQLKQMSQDLKEIIEHLNEANRSQDSSDPIVQIGKILNAHMNSLQWLDQKTTVIGHKIQQIDQMHTNFRQENERSFNLAYN